MAPVIDVDDQALCEGGNIGGVKHVVDRLPCCADKEKIRARRNSDERKGKITEAGKPSPGDESVEEAVMRVLGKVAIELQRADAERMLQRYIGAEKKAAEPAVLTCVVGLLQRSAFPENVRHLTE